ncbi:unnamed protein product [Spirodela intermedia]|uniref:Uncharacterized protein n=1 Tax=Spirodela intermedia TaxID=51605 RepID=A0A7I8JRQ3_SPIIN|nr:unnamed protein product [Spirodela intermedia]CAA6672804.1 unnamed protein product [Spirodela intermedia]
MCCRANEVYGSTVDTVIKTLVSVLSSSVSCNVLRRGEANKRGVEILRVGSSICLADTEKLIRACIDVLGSLKGHVLYRPLFCGVLKVAVSASDYQSLFPISSAYYERCEIPRVRSRISLWSSCRLLLWYLDPSLLKDEISNLLKEVIHRPFLCLKDEFHERMTWRILIMCLVTSPTAFTLIRDLLHKWFLMTGLASVNDLQIALVSSLLDALSRPMWWGFSTELALKLPFLHAYFPTCHTQLLAALTEPTSCDGLLNLVKLIEPHPAPPSQKIHVATPHLPRIDCNSTWAMLMSFPSWFDFAAALIFRGEKLIGNEMTLQQAASRYLAFVLSPLKEEGFDLCCHVLGEVSRSWAATSSSGFWSLPSSDLRAHEKSGSVGRKKLRKRKAAGGEGTGAEIWLWKFHERYEEFCNGAAAGQSQSEVRTMEIVDPRSSPLFRRLPLGILTSHSGLLDEGEFALLVNYAATGELLPVKTRSTSGEWPLRGAALVFSLFDHIEEISTALFDQEGETTAFVHLMRSKTSGYLLMCVRELLQSRSRPEDGGGEGEIMLKDLSVRLARWREQGGEEAFEGYAAFGDILDDINRI